MSLLGYHVPLLRSIPEELGLAPVGEVAQRPGVADVCRITVHYYDRRACDSVATVINARTSGASLETVYRRALGHKPLLHPLTEARYRAFFLALRAAGFDKLVDQDGLPAYDSTDVWMIERAAGTFIRSVVVAPDIVKSAPHTALMTAVQTHLPEALRMVK